MGSSRQSSVARANTGERYMATNSTFSSFSAIRWIRGWAYDWHNNRIIDWLIISPLVHACFSHHSEHVLQ